MAGHQVVVLLALTNIMVDIESFIVDSFVELQAIPVVSDHQMVTLSLFLLICSHVGYLTINRFFVFIMLILCFKMYRIYRTKRSVNIPNTLYYEMLKVALYIYLCVGFYYVVLVYMFIMPFETMVAWSVYYTFTYITLPLSSFLLKMSFKGTYIGELLALLIPVISVTYWSPTRKENIDCVHCFFFALFIVSQICVLWYVLTRKAKLLAVCFQHKFSFCAFVILVLLCVVSNGPEGIIVLFGLLSMMCIYKLFSLFLRSVILMIVKTVSLRKNKTLLLVVIFKQIISFYFIYELYSFNSYEGSGVISGTNTAQQRCYTRYSLNGIQSQFCQTFIGHSYVLKCSVPSIDLHRSELKWIVNDTVIDAHHPNYFIETRINNIHHTSYLAIHNVSELDFNAKFVCASKCFQYGCVAANKQFFYILPLLPLNLSVMLSRFTFFKIKYLFYSQQVPVDVQLQRIVPRGKIITNSSELNLACRGLSGVIKGPESVFHLKRKYWKNKVTVTMCVDTDSYGTYQFVYRTTEASPYKVHPIYLLILPKSSPSNLRIFDESQLYDRIIDSYTGKHKAHLVDSTFYLMCSIENVNSIASSIYWVLQILVYILLFMVLITIINFVIRILLNQEEFKDAFTNNQHPGEATHRENCDIYVSVCDNDEVVYKDILLPFLTSNGCTVTSAANIRPGTSVYESRWRLIQSSRIVLLVWSNDFHEDKDSFDVEFKTIFKEMLTHGMMDSSKVVVLNLDEHPIPFIYRCLLGHEMIRLGRNSEETMNTLLAIIDRLLQRRQTWFNLFRPILRYIRILWNMYMWL